MDNINEIKTELDMLYKLYKKNRYTLNVTQTNDVVQLLKKLSQNGEAKDVAERLVVFSSDVCGQYFDELAKGSVTPLSIVESIINSYISVITDTSREHYYVKKHATMAIKVINNYTDVSYDSKTIAKLIALVACIGLKSNTNMAQFERVVLETNGKIYLVNYSSISEQSLANVNKITETLLHSEKLKVYSSLISDWSIKYGFTENVLDNVTADSKVQIEEPTVAKETPKEETFSAMQPPVKKENVNPTLKKKKNKASVNKDDISEKKEKPTTESVSAKDDTPSKKPVESAGEKNSNNAHEGTVIEKAPAQKDAAQVLYDRLKCDMDKEQKAIITAFTDMITPVGKAFESIQGEINKSRAVGAENALLKAKIEDLGKQLSEQKARVQTANQSLVSAKAEIEELKKQLSCLEIRNSELDSKLNDAYAINSRESSLEAEKIRSELKKSFAFLYEDWLEYEFSNVSEENYESLQAIIKKIFRSLERNGIDFKGNN